MAGEDTWGGTLLPAWSSLGGNSPVPRGGTAGVTWGHLSQAGRGLPQLPLPQHGQGEALGSGQRSLARPGALFGQVRRPWARSEVLFGQVRGSF